MDIDLIPTLPVTPPLPEAVSQLLHQCAVHYNALPSLVRIAYGNRDHNTYSDVAWTQYLAQLDTALLQTMPETVPPPVLEAFLNVMIAQLEVLA